MSECDFWIQLVYVSQQQMIPYIPLKGFHLSIAAPPSHSTDTTEKLVK